MIGVKISGVRHDDDDFVRSMRAQRGSGVSRRVRAFNRHRAEIGGPCHRSPDRESVQRGVIGIEDSDFKLRFCAMDRIERLGLDFSPGDAWLDGGDIDVESIARSVRDNSVVGLDPCVDIHVEDLCVASLPRCETGTERLLRVAKCGDVA